MLTFKTFKKIYPTASYCKYIFSIFTNKLKKISRIPYCTYMCIKYPFLYPRNVYTGLHYNNYTISTWLKKMYQKYHKTVVLDDENTKSLGDYKNMWFKVQNGQIIDFWINWWTKPLYSGLKFFHNYILQIFHCLPTYTMWDCVEEGWRKAFGKQYLKELKNQLKKEKMLYKWRITDIKEKWGQFQLYSNYCSEELYNIIFKYEDLSWNFCKKCGEPATHTSIGWISPYCQKCAPKGSVTFKEFEKMIGKC